MRAAAERRLQLNEQDDDSRRRRPIVRPRHGHLRHEPLRRVHRPVRIHQYGDSGVTPTFLLDQGIPAYPLPPQINPAFSNNRGIDYWNGDAAMTPATYDTWTISMQREVRRGMTVEVDYNGSKGSNLQANLLNINQVPLSVVNDLIARLGTHGGDRAAEHAGEFAGGGCGGHQDSVRELHQSRDSDDAKRRAGAAAVSAVRQRSTRPTAAATRPARSMYHAGVFKLTQRMTTDSCSRAATRTRS